MTACRRSKFIKKWPPFVRLEEAADLHEELVDRFGDLPQAVFNLLAVASLKVYGSEYRIETISQKGDDYLIKMHIDQNGKMDGRSC